MEPLLSVRALRVAYGERPVLRGLDLEVAAGEVVGLVGPNGCGKTTLLRAIARLVAWLEGEVLVGGRSAAALTAPQLARLLAVVPQGPALPLGYTARDVVVMGRTAHLGFLQQESPRDLAAADEAMALAGCDHLGERRVDELSGGERQAVVIARALAQAAPLLLLDEPTANLDIGHQMAIAALLRRLAAERGYGVLAAVHDLTLAGLFCDRLALLHEGRVLAQGCPADVLTRDNLQRAYGVEVAIARLEGIGSPVVVPVEPPRS